MFISLLEHHMVPYEQCMIHRIVDHFTQIWYWGGDRGSSPPEISGQTWFSASKSEVMQ